MAMRTEQPKLADAGKSGEVRARPAGQPPKVARPNRPTFWELLRRSLASVVW
jgi:hypothetical protein